MVVEWDFEGQGMYIDFLFNFQYYVGDDIKIKVQK